MKSRKKLILFTLIAMNLVDQPAPEVTIEQGILSGIVSADGSILEYIGIPYATVNSSNRFQAPYPPPKWDGVFKATEEYSCPQHFDKLGLIGSEDCLRVNVYIPAFAKKPLPVMVFVHGGGFVVGSGGKMVYGPEYLVKHDVILVTFNYRLGVLGFLCLGIEEVPGNAGIKDQIAALRWIKKNIAAFGGDSDNITIFGESAGGTSTSILIAIEATNGLFNKAIVQSGTSISSWSLNRHPVQIASLLTKSLGYDTEDPHDIHKILSSFSLKDLLSKTRVKKPKSKFFDTELIHLPCVEKILPGIESAIPDLPFNLLKTNPKNIPVIYGSNTKEGLFLITEETPEDLEDRNNRYVFASDLEFRTEKEADDLDDRIKKFYFGTDRISIAKRFNISDLYTHLYFEEPEIMEAELLLNETKAKVYNYIFNYSGGRNFLKERSGFGNELGACHADELLYLFKGWIWPFRVSEEDQKMIYIMTKLWTDFAKYSDPTPASSDVPVKWKASTRGELNFLYIDKEMRMGPMPNPRAYTMWRDVYHKYRKKDLKHYY